MKIKETFDITPDTSVMNILGSSGYSLETAIADIIDNSIYAQAHNIYVDFEFNGPNTIIKIIDDGIGMNLEKLKNACIIGYDYFNNKRESSDLGKFSTGLKSASKAVASKLIIQSVTDETNTVLLDFDNMNKVG
ncbi:ATP-binding protein [bacterium]|nr:ATP-binding protein [bacterium]